MRTFGPATFHYAEGGGTQSSDLSSSRKRWEAHFCMCMCTGAAWKYVCGLYVFMNTGYICSGGVGAPEVHECKGEKGKNKICHVDGTDVTNARRLGAGEVSVSPLAQTWRAIRGRWRG